jgi:hypothetical protein
MQTSAAEEGIEERGAAELLRDLLAQIRTLLRQELALVRAESREALGRLGQGLAALAIAALLAVSGWLALLAAAVLGLAIIVPAWLAALIVAGAALALAAAFLVFARSRLALRSLAPRRTLASLRANQEWEPRS